MANAVFIIPTAEQPSPPQDEGTEGPHRAEGWQLRPSSSFAVKHPPAPPCAAPEHVGVCRRGGQGNKPPPSSLPRPQPGAAGARESRCSSASGRPLSSTVCPDPEGLSQGLAVVQAERRPRMASVSLQVIQEVSGLPVEGASDGNQYSPDVQRLNCQKVSLYPAWKRVQFSAFSVKIRLHQPRE